MQLVWHLFGRHYGTPYFQKHEDQYNYNIDPPNWYLTSQRKYCTQPLLEDCKSVFNLPSLLQVTIKDSNRCSDDVKINISASQLTSSGEHPGPHFNTTKTGVLRLGALFTMMKREETENILQNYLTAKFQICAIFFSWKNLAHRNGFRILQTVTYIIGWILPNSSPDIVSWLSSIEYRKIKSLAIS